MQNNSFERFYYTKVALGEGCGCAEQIITTQDLERHAHEASRGGEARETSRSVRAWLRRLVRGGSAACRLLQSPR